MSRLEDALAARRFVVTAELLTVNAGGLDAFLMKAKDDELSVKALELKRQIRKKQAAA